MAPYAAKLIHEAPWNPSFTDGSYSLVRSRESNDHRTTNVSHCGNNLLDLKIGESGYIQSPNYPEDYPPNADCTWWLKAGLLVANIKDIISKMDYSCLSFCNYSVLFSFHFLIAV